MINITYIIIDTNYKTKDFKYFKIDVAVVSVLCVTWV
jgi:hypothetical protein